MFYDFSAVSNDHYISRVAQDYALNDNEKPSILHDICKNKPKNKIQQDIIELPLGIWRDDGWNDQVHNFLTLKLNWGLPKNRISREPRLTFLKEHQIYQSKLVLQVINFDIQFATKLLNIPGNTKIIIIKLNLIHQKWNAPSPGYVVVLTANLFTTVSIHHYISIMLLLANIYCILGYNFFQIFCKIFKIQGPSSTLTQPYQHHMIAVENCPIAQCDACSLPIYGTQFTCQRCSRTAHVRCAPMVRVVLWLNSSIRSYTTLVRFSSHFGLFVISDTRLSLEILIFTTSST